MIDICPGVTISEHELRFSFERCTGSGGGQSTNKVNTRVTLHFDVSNSTSLSRAQKNAVCQSLATRITQDGILRIHSSKERTQLANRRAAINRFIELMSTAFRKSQARKESGGNNSRKTHAKQESRRSNGRRTR